MKRILIWDIPVRLFHWLLAASFIAAFLIAQLVDDDGSAFIIHMLLGGVAAFMVLLRIVWGIVGTRWARFSGFQLNPTEFVRYVKGAFTGREKRYDGHNPGSSIAAMLMFVFILGLAFTGVMMGNGGGEVYEELHEILAWAMVAVVGAHLAGIAWYSVRHRENIARSMIDGRKEAAPTGGIQSVRPVVALVFLVLTGLWTLGLVRGYDAQRQRLTIPLTGQSLQVGEGEHHDSERRHDRDEREREEH